MSKPVAELAAHAAGLPLVVDVDGTLVASDLLQEAALRFVAQTPLQAFRLPLWLAGGKAPLKARLAERVDPGIDTVPLRPEVVGMIRAAQAEGRPVYLASASDRRYVELVAARVGGIAGVFGTEGDRNLAGPAKAEQLVAAFGPGGFDYVGDSAVDVPVWREARRALVVARSDGFAARVRAALPQAEMVGGPQPDPRAYLAALRPHQWAKNALLFLPMFAGHRLELGTVLATGVAFLCFCLAASSAYLVNDLLDLPADRDHPRKRHRPFAAGRLPIVHGLAMSAGALVGAFLLSLALPPGFAAILAVYTVSTLAYSIALKRRVLVDVVVLSGLYTLRVYGGLAAIAAAQSQWLLMLSLFLFLSLALVKRCSELVSRRAAGKTDVLGRGYRVGDLAVLLPLAAAAGYGAVFVVALYASSPEARTLYAHHNRIWLICPLLAYWISRVLLKSSRGELHDDPVVFALTDRVSWAVALGTALIILLAA